MDTSMVKTGSACCVPLCSRHSGIQGIRMLRFPRPFKERAVWSKRIRREDWEPKYSSRICSWHFPTGDRKLGPTRFPWDEDEHMSTDRNYPVSKDDPDSEPGLDSEPAYTRTRLGQGRTQQRQLTKPNHAESTAICAICCKQPATQAQVIRSSVSTCHWESWMQECAESVCKALDLEMELVKTLFKVDGQCCSCQKLLFDMDFIVRRVASMNERLSALKLELLSLIDNTATAARKKIDECAPSAICYGDSTFNQEVIEVKQEWTASQDDFTVVQSHHDKKLQEACLFDGNPETEDDTNNCFLDLDVDPSLHQRLAALKERVKDPHLPVVLPVPLFDPDGHGSLKSKRKQDLSTVRRDWCNPDSQPTKRRGYGRREKVLGPPQPLSPEMEATNTNEDSGVIGTTSLKRSDHDEHPDVQRLKLKKNRMKMLKAALPSHCQTLQSDPNPAPSCIGGRRSNYFFSAQTNSARNNSKNYENLSQNYIVTSRPPTISDNDLPCASISNGPSTKSLTKGPKPKPTSSRKYTKKCTLGKEFLNKNIAGHKASSVIRFLAQLDLEDAPRSGRGSHKCPVVSCHLTPSYLKAHILREHSELVYHNTSQCLLCPKKFSSDCDLDAHVIHAHVDQPYYSFCPVTRCLVEHRRHEYFLQHFAVKHSDSSGRDFNSWQCPLCCEGFIRDYHLDAHILRCHQDQEECFVCTKKECGMAFKDQGDFLNHFVQHHYCK